MRATWAVGILAVAAAFVVVAQDAAAFGEPLTNGRVQLAVSPLGGIHHCVSDYGSACLVPAPPGTNGRKQTIGLRHMASNLEGADRPETPTESWNFMGDSFGVAARHTNDPAYTVACMDWGSPFRKCGGPGTDTGVDNAKGAVTTAGSPFPTNAGVTDVLNETLVIHTTWDPAASPDLFELRITFENQNARDVDSLLYRRHFSLNAGVDGSEQALTIDYLGSAPPAALAGAYPADLTEVNPLVPPATACWLDGRGGPMTSGFMTDFIQHAFRAPYYDGRCFGATFDLDLGAISGGSSKSFFMYLGASANEAAAMAALDAVEADVFALSQITTSNPSNSPDVTFIWAFGGLRPPEPAFDWLPITPCAGRPVEFTDLTVSALDLVDGSWDFGDGSTAPYAGDASHTYASPGTFTVTLRVENENGWDASVSHDVTVIDCPPVAAFTCVTDYVNYLRVAFKDGSGGLFGASITGRQWSFGDGSTASGPVTQHLYANEAAYTASLTVTDEYGKTATTSRVCVAFRNDPPVIAPIPDIVVYYNEAIRVVPSATDPDGDPLLFSWIPGILPYPASFGGQSLAWTPSVVDLGVHGPVTIKVTDGEFWDETTFMITVLDIGDAKPPVNADADADGKTDAADSCPAGGICEAIALVAAPPPPTTSTTRALDVVDTDRDGVIDPADNCRLTPNPTQADFDADGIGDVCDEDVDGDRVLDWNGLVPLDNCHWLYNPDQADNDRDGVGDACTGDRDSDGVPDHDVFGRPLDNCVWTPNPDQTDLDQDGRGDACLPGDGPAHASLRLSGFASGPADHTTPPAWLLLIPLTAALLGWRAWRSAAGLFSRLPRDRLLEHPLRQRILQSVEGEPGIHVARLARMVAASKATTKHHVQLLAQAGLVRLEKGPRYAMVFPAARIDPDVRHAQRFLRSQVARDTLQAVVAHPGVRVADVPAHAHASYSNVWYHLQRMAKGGIVELRGSDDGLVAYPAHGAREALD